MKLEDIELRSESVQDILSRPPQWMFRWGNTIIIMIILMLLLMSWFIKYPEFIPAQIIITSQNPPEKLEARTNSKIEKIWIANGQKVKKGDLLMVLQSSADYQNLLQLKKIINSIPPENIKSFPIAITNHFKLGELQADYNAFAKAFREEQLFTKLRPYSPESVAAEQSLSEYSGRIATLKQQLNLENMKFDLSKKNFMRSQSLFEQGVIAKMELENEKIKFLQAEQNVKSMSISLSQMQEAIANIHKTKAGTSINSEKDKINYASLTQQLLVQLQKSLVQWEQNYLFVATDNGTVSYQNIIGENQFVKTGEVLLSVLPENKNAIIGRMVVPANNTGKIAKDEKVLIKLDNFRYQEFGIVQGKVQNISLTPNEKGEYFVVVLLPDGLKTSYNKTLPFDKELKGNAEIVTQDLRLLERFFYQIRQLLGHQV